MKAPAFWWRAERGAVALALWPFAGLYGVVAQSRMERPPRYRAPVPVICIGNFVVGGAGKTPTAIALAEMAKARGLRPGFVAAGYGGNAEGALLVEPAASTARLTGDEALLLAAVAPTVIGRDRAAAARRLIREPVDLLIMDDGFQSPNIAKDLSLVVVDGGAGIGNGMVLPAGPLRAPLAPQLRRADAVVIVGEGGEAVIRAAARAGRPVLRAELNAIRPDEWRGVPVLAFAGIGRPSKFFASLAAAGAILAETAEFPDHHPYDEAEALDLMARAAAGGLRLVTTAKDIARLTGASGAAADLRERATAFAVTLVFENPAAVGALLDEAVRKAAGAR